MKAFEKTKTPAAGKAPVAPQRPRVAAYVRVSTDEQAKEGYSIDAQRTVITSYCNTYGYDVAEWYVDDGYSAYTGDKRPAFDRMMADVDRWDICVAKWTNRFWRRVQPALAWAAALAAGGKEFADVTNRIDTSTAMGRAFWQITLVFAELESGQTSERVKAAFDEKIAGGDPVLGQAPPFGYKWTGEQRGDEFLERAGKLATVPADAAIVKRIFAWRAKHKPYQWIAKELGWCTCAAMPLRKRRVSHRMKSGAIKTYEYDVPGEHCTGCWRTEYILNNPVYVGYMRFGEKLVKNGHELLVDRKTFEKVQQMRRKVYIELPAA